MTFGSGGRSDVLFTATTVHASNTLFPRQAGEPVPSLLPIILQVQYVRNTDHCANI